MKVYIDCGPNLRTTRVLRIRPKMGQVMRMDFPEAHYGAQEIRNQIDDAIKMGVDTLFITTRFETALYYCGELREEGILKKVRISLTIDGGKTYTEYQFTEDGIVSEGWPFGILS